MKNELDRLFFFNDLLGDLQELQNQSLQVTFNLSEFLLNPQVPQKHFIVPRIDEHRQTELFFSAPLTDMIDSLYMFKQEQIDPELLRFERDFSYLLELRRHFLSFCLYEDELLEIEIKVKDQILATKQVLSKSLYLCNLQLLLDISCPEFLNLINNGAEVQLTIEVVRKGQLRKDIDKIVSVDQVLQDCRNTFFRLIGYGVFNREVEYFTKAFKRFKIIPQNLPDNEVLVHLDRLNLSCFSHLDFFDWGELLFTFSFKGNFTAYKRKLRLQARQRIKILKSKQPWPVIPLNSI